MRMPAFVLTLMAVTLGLVPVSAQDAAKVSPQEQIAESVKKVKELQAERIAALRELVDINRRLFQHARIEFAEVIDAQGLLFEAELEAAEKESDRIAIYQNMVDLLKQDEQFAAGRVERAQGSSAAVFKIRAKRLQAEIRLVQAKLKEAQEKGTPRP